MPSPLLALPLIAGDQAQKHVTANEAAVALEAFSVAVVVSATTAAPPFAPDDGAIYIVPSGGWAGVAAAGSLAHYRGGLWVAIAPRFGWRFFVADEGVERVFCGASLGWRVGAAAGPLAGATSGLRVFEAILDLAGASVSAAGLIPTRATIFGVTSWTIEPITGATSYKVGDSGDAGRFGDFLGVAAGSSNIGVVGPFATYSPDAVVVTANGPAFTGGRVGVAVSAIVHTVPL